MVYEQEVSNTLGVWTGSEQYSEVYGLEVNDKLVVEIRYVNV